LRLDTSGFDTAGKRVDHVRLDLIARTGETGELWWVAREFDDATTKPEGLFADGDAARRLAGELATSLGVDVVVTDLNDK